MPEVHKITGSLPGRITEYLKDKERLPGRITDLLKDKERLPDFYENNGLASGFLRG